MELIDDDAAGSNFVNKQIGFARKIGFGLFNKPVVFVSERRKGTDESAKFDWLFRI